MSQEDGDGHNLEQFIPAFDEDFELDASTAKELIGAKSLNDSLSLVCKHILDPKQSLQIDQLKYRFAPSLVARAELELFGLSMPRFAIRVYLGDGMFVNARRIAELQRMDPEWGTRRDASDSWNHATDHHGLPIIPSNEHYRRPSDVIAEASCIADSLLKPRPQVREHFEVLSAELSPAYGEGPGRGTPFVRHIKLSAGGMCAQAVCYMAMALRHDDRHVSSRRTEGLTVHGLPEVTALAASPYTNELLLTGLIPSEMRSYFEDVIGGLSVWQYPASAEGPTPIYERFAAVLRAYVLGGVPVIPVLDIDRMAGIGPDPKFNVSNAPMEYARKHPLPETSIYAVNGLDDTVKRMRVKAAQRRKENRRHCALIVGCHRQDPSKFLLNDPATLPFMEVSAEQLWLASPTRPAQGHALFLAVTPAAVRLPLESWIDDAYQRHPGLLDFSTLMHQAAAAGLIDLPKTAYPFDVGHFALTQLRHLVNSSQDVAHSPSGSSTSTRDVAVNRLSLALPDLGSAELALLGKELAKALGGLDETKLDKWLWVHYCPAASGSGRTPTVWIWDAEAEPLKQGVLNKKDIPAVQAALLLVATSQGTALHWSFRKPPHAQPRPSERAAPEEDLDSPEIPSGACSVQPALISSFSVSGTDAAARQWPDKSIACELYAFMHRDACLNCWPGDPRDEEDPLGIPIGPSAMAILADRADSTTAIKHAADYVLSRMDRAGTKVIGLATFIPELVASRADRRAYGRAQRAIQFLIRMVREIRAQSRGTHNPHQIELVTGGRIDGVWPFDKTSGAITTQSNAENSTSGGSDARSADDASLGPDGFVANRISVEEGLARLHERLGPIAREASQPGNDRVYLACELEPGPLYVMRGIRELSALCKILRSDKVLSPVVGLNLDIAHWKLARVPLGWLRSDSARMIRDRVVHVHLSDHGRAHFGDCPPGDVGFGEYPEGDEEQRLSAFKPWMQLVRQIAAENGSRFPNMPSFSGYVSLEIEGVKNRETLRRAADRFVSLFK